MPTYEFECRNCGKVTEAAYSMSSKPSSIMCSCGSEANSIISLNTNSYVANREYVFDQGDCVQNFGRNVGRSASQQHRHYQNYFGDIKKRRRRMKGSNTLKNGMEWIGGMPGEMADSIGMHEGDPEAVSKDPEVFLKKTGMHAEQE